MNKENYLLVCLAEECAEVQKEVSKALRFGLDDTNPSTKIKNRNSIVNELNDTLAIIDLLVDNGTLMFDEYKSIKQVHKKKTRVKKWMMYSREKNCLKD